MVQWSLVVGPAPRACGDGPQLFFGGQSAPRQRGTRKPRPAHQAGDTDTKDPGFAQQAAAKVTDPRWSAIATMPAEQAMTTLGGLCREIGHG
jgi:hypothetical protein